MYFQTKCDSFGDHDVSEQKMRFISKNYEHTLKQDYKKFVCLHF